MRFQGVEVALVVFINLDRIASACCRASVAVQPSWAANSGSRSQKRPSQARRAGPAAGMSKAFTLAGRRLRRFWGGFMDFFYRLKQFFGRLKEFFGPLNKFFGSLKQFFGRLHKFLQPLNKFFGTLKEIFGSLKDFFGRLHKLRQTLKKLLGRLKDFFGSLKELFWRSKELFERLNKLPTTLRARPGRSPKMPDWRRQLRKDWLKLFIGNRMFYPGRRQFKLTGCSPAKDSTKLIPL
jgi:hypothetical protein